MQNEEQSQTRRESAVARLPLVAPVLAAAALFGKARAVVIEHEGERYLLRITRNGKLILTK